MELRDYQKSDVQRIRQTNSLGIFSQQRTGKTPTAIVGMTEKCTRILVVCPNTLVYNWAAEFKRWVNKDVTVITKMEIPKYCADIVIINYEKLADTKALRYSCFTILNFVGFIYDKPFKVKL